MAIARPTAASYNHPGDKLPKVSLTLVNSNGDEVTLDRGVNASYDIDGYKGTGIRTMKIEQAGTYRLDVESDDTDFAVAIGKNPKDDSEKLLLIGGAVALGGLIFGLLFFLLGLRRRPPDMAIDIRDRVGPLPGWPPSTYPGLVPTPPSPPPAVGGYQPVPVPPTAPTTFNYRDSRPSACPTSHLARASHRQRLHRRRHRRPTHGQVVR